MGSWGQDADRRKGSQGADRTWLSPPKEEEKLGKGSKNHLFYTSITSLMSIESMTSSKTDPLDLAATVPNFRLDPRQRLASEGAGADAVQSLGLRESGIDQRGEAANRPPALSLQDIHNHKTQGLSSFKILRYLPAQLLSLVGK